MSKLEFGTAAWLVVLVASVLGILFFPGIPKGKDWMDVLTLLVTAGSAMATAAAVFIALYVHWYQHKALEHQAKKAMREAGAGLAYKLGSLMEACDEANPWTLEARIPALENIERQLQAVRGELFVDIEYIQVLIRLRDIATQAVALVRLTTERGVLNPGDLRHRLAKLRLAAHDAHWSLADPALLKPALDPMEPPGAAAAAV